MGGTQWLNRWLLALLHLNQFSAGYSRARARVRLIHEPGTVNAVNTQSRVTCPVLCRAFQRRLYSYCYVYSIYLILNYYFPSSRPKILARFKRLPPSSLNASYYFWLFSFSAMSFLFLACFGLGTYPVYVCVCVSATHLVNVYSLVLGDRSNERNSDRVQHNASLLGAPFHHSAVLRHM